MVAETQRELKDDLNENKSHSRMTIISRSCLKKISITCSQVIIYNLPFVLLGLLKYQLMLSRITQSKKAPQLSHLLELYQFFLYRY